jgi:uncharacterized membrane protein
LFSAAGSRSYRLTAIDMLRGLAIVVMAIDHVRDYFLAGTDVDPMANPNISAALFATRWITHFCAPVFVLLAGTSAGLMVARKSRGELARFLFTRGVWLILIEILVIATAWTFSPGGLAEVGGLTWTAMQVIGPSARAWSYLRPPVLGRNACLPLGAAVIAAHNTRSDLASGQLADQQWLRGSPCIHDVIRGTVPVLVSISGAAVDRVMLLGWNLRSLLNVPGTRRNAILLGGARPHGGLSSPPRVGDLWRSVAASQPGGITATAIDFLNVSKYPPSLLYLMMTLGPAAILCGVADRISRGIPGVIKDALVMFGRVPFAFYVAHLYLIHLLSVLLGLSQGFSLHQMMTSSRFYPKAGIGLPEVSGVGLVLAMLYPLTDGSQA